jgi:hypothetical protein
LTKNRYCAHNYDILLLRFLVQRSTPVKYASLPLS